MDHNIACAAQIVAYKFPCVYRCSLKFIKKMTASSFQERVFSTSKNILSVSRSGLGPALFEALVTLRHNARTIRRWTKGAELIAEHVRMAEDLCTEVADARERDDIAAAIAQIKLDA